MEALKRNTLYKLTYRHFDNRAHESTQGAFIRKETRFNFILCLVFKVKGNNEISIPEYLLESVIPI